MSSKQTYMLKVAAVALRKSASKIQQLYEDNEKLSNELLDLKKEANEAHAFEEAKKIAGKMHEKGLIKKADIEARAYEISKFDEEAMEMLNATLNSQEKVASVGASDLSQFMFEQENDPLLQMKKKNMADSIISAAEELYENY